MDDNIIQLFKTNIFDEIVTEIGERLQDSQGGEVATEILVTYIGAAARLWAEVEGYPHVQKELAHLAVELERIFTD